MKKRSRLTGKKFRGFHADYYLSQRRQERCIAKMLAVIPETAKAVRLIERRRPAVQWLITRDTYPEKIRGTPHEWRATRIDEYGPSSHFNGPDVPTIIASLNGRRTPDCGLPYASAGELTVSQVR